MLWSIYSFLDADVLMMKSFKSLNTIEVQLLDRKKGNLFNLFLPRNNKPYQG